MTCPCKVDPFVTVAHFLEGRAHYASIQEVMDIRAWSLSRPTDVGFVPRPLWWLPKANKL